MFYYLKLNLLLLLNIPIGTKNQLHCLMKSLPSVVNKTLRKILKWITFKFISTDGCGN
jgi:hypothetical protein